MKSADSFDPEEGHHEELGSQGRGSTHAVWAQRRQAKRRANVRAKRHRASMAAMNGMHLRRKKRVTW